MASKIVTREEMLERVAVFKQLTPSARPLVDAVLPQFHREIFNVIGGGVTEDASMKVPITAVDGFHLSIIKAGPKFEILAQNDLGEEISASPAVSNGRIYLRTFDALYAIGK